MQERQHRSVLIYTLIFFGLVGAIAFWQLALLQDSVDLTNTMPAESLRIDLNAIF